MDGPSFTKQNEGCSLVSYQDTLGFYTIGYGHKLGADKSFAGTSWTQQQADDVFLADYGIAAQGAQADVGAVCWNSLDPIRRSALVDMAFQMGEAGLGMFKEMLAAILQQDWQIASAECLDSEYAKQTPTRAERNASIFATGQWPA